MRPHKHATAPALALALSLLLAVFASAGTSGKSYNGLSANKTETTTSPPPASDLALFTGQTDIIPPAIATGTSHLTGPGNAAYSFSTSASAETTVSHTWMIPEPGGALALVVGLVGLGVFVARRRR